MVTRYEGRDGALVVDGEFIVIEHHDKSAGDLRVRLSSLSDVHFEPATRWVSGIVTIVVDGDALHVPTGTEPGTDPTTVVFRHKANGVFSEVHAWLKQVVEKNRGRP